MSKILIIDDSLVMRNIHKNALKENNISGDRLLEACDGSEALELLQHNEVSLIVVDWNMPALNGLEFVKRVRGVEKYATLPIIMVTSEAGRMNVMQAVQAGVTNYVVKPITGQDLWNKFKDHIN